MPDTSVIRISHCRFLNGNRVRRHEKYDRVITVVWTYDQENSILRYGASDFDSTSSKDSWNKGVYRRIAVDRYEAYPVVCTFELNDVMPKYGEKIGSSIDTYITNLLIARFGKGSRKDYQETSEFLYAYKKGKKQGYKSGYYSGYYSGYENGYNCGCHGYEFGYNSVVLIGLCYALYYFYF